MPPIRSEPPITPAAAAAAVPRNEPPPDCGRLLHRRTLLIAALLITALLVPGGMQHRCPHGVPPACGTRGTEPRGSSRPKMLSRMLSRKPRGCPCCCLRPAVGLLIFLDAVIRRLERLVLHQHGLHQRIDSVRRAAHAFADHRLGVRIARVRLQRGQALEQLGDELAFLRCHVVLLGPSGARLIWGVIIAPEMAQA